MGLRTSFQARYFPRLFLLYIGQVSAHPAPEIQMHDNLWKMQGYLNPWVWRWAYTAISVSLATECDSCFLLTRSHRMSPSPILSTRFSTNCHLPEWPQLWEDWNPYFLLSYSTYFFFFFHWSWKVQVTRCLS